MRPKVPRLPPPTLTGTDDDLVDVDGPLLRLVRTRGTHLTGWDQLRTWGPLRQMRWDPHPSPHGQLGEAADHPSYGVLYAALDLDTVLAEVFQDTRRVDPDSGAPHLLGWLPTRPLRLLDLTHGWPLRNGAAHALNHAPKVTCRAWAHAVRTSWPTLDGLLAESTMTGAPVLALFDPARDSFPSHPALSRPLTHAAVWARARDAAARIGYRID